MLACYYFSQVDFELFQADLQSRASRPTARDADVPTGTPGRGIEFRRAMEASLGRSVPSARSSLSQAELARSLGPKINKLFSDFDTGMHCVFVCACMWASVFECSFPCISQDDTVLKCEMCEGVSHACLSSYVVLHNVIA